MLPNAFPPDHGPIYMETDLSRFPVEPWATWSEFLFLAVILYWAWRVFRSEEGWRGHGFTSLCLPLLLVQFVGATVYHATRSHMAWMLLDVLPLYLVCLLAAGYFWKRFGLSMPLAAAGALLPPLAGMGLGRILPLPTSLGMALTYAGFFLALFIPAFALLPRLAPNRRLLAPAALLALALALTFRSVDHMGHGLPMGTHWLWHGFGALAVHLLVWFSFSLEQRPERGI